jgi:hypothetical protein
VEYCAEAGIVEGYEDGNFYPNRVLSSTEWLKMLVAALRYDANKLNGKDWKKYTYDAAIAYGVITAEEFDLKFDRETAILYAFNALTSEAWTTDSMADSRYDLQEKIVYDEFCRPTERQIISNGKVVTTFAITADEKANGTVTVKSASDPMYVEDGVWAYTTGTELGGNSATVYTYDNYNWINASKTHTYVYGQDFGKQVVVINTYVQKLTDTDTTKAFAKLDTKETLKVGDVVTYNVGNKMWTESKNVAVNLNVARVTGVAGTVTAANRDAKDNYVKIDYGSAVKFARYAQDGTRAATDPLTTLATNQKYTLYYDAYGNIIYAEDYTEPAREGDLVFLTKVSATAVPVVTEGEGVEYKYTYKLQYMDLTDGSLKTATVNLPEGQTKPANVPSVDFATEVNSAVNNGVYPILTDAAAPLKYYEIAANEDGTVDVLGEYKFEDAAHTQYATQSSAAVTKDTAAYELGDYKTGLADSNTVLTVISYKDAFETETYVTEAGIAKFTTATYSLDKTYTTAVIGENGYATKIYVIAPVAVPEITYVYAMYTGLGEDTSDDGQIYKFVGSDGEAFEITYAQLPKNPENGSDAFEAIKNKTITAGTVVKLSKQNGEFIAAEVLNVAATGELRNRDFNNMNVAGTVYYYAAGFGDKVISTTSYKEVAVAIKGRDENDCFAAGSDVNLYTDGGKVVFATTTPASSAE